MRCEPQSRSSPYLVTSTADMDLSCWRVVNQGEPREA
jgi:hypothetical protein